MTRPKGKVDANPPPPKRFNVQHPLPPPHSEPLHLLAFGRPNPITGRPILGTGSVKLYNDVVETALAFGIALVAHPRGLELAATGLAHDPDNTPLIKHAIAHVLATHQWIILINPGLDFNTFGVHIRPAQASYDSGQAHTIYLNLWHLKRLREALDRLEMATEEDALDAEKAYYRHLYASAMGFAHEIVHALRAQVFYTMREYINVRIEFDTPSRGGAPAESGWEWELNMSGGLLYGVWDVPPPTAALDDLEDQEVKRFIKEKEAMTGEKVAIAHMSEKRTGPRMEFRVTPFHKLIVDDQEGKTWEVSAKWLRNLCDAWERKDITKIKFPPTVAAKVEEGTVAKLGLAGGTRQPDIIRMSQVHTAPKITPMSNTPASGSPTSNSSSPCSTSPRQRW